MSWQIEMTEILRVMLGDFEATEYTDNVLQRLIVVAAQFTANELDFSQTFTANINSLDIIPDPTNSESRDDPFINLTCMKAACLANRGDSWIKSKKALVIKDIGGIMVDTRDVFKAKYNLLLKGGWCPVYEEEKLIYETTGSVPGKAILSPFRTYINNVRRYW